VVHTYVCDSDQVRESQGARYNSNVRSLTDGADNRERDIVADDVGRIPKAAYTNLTQNVPNQYSLFYKE
jgi:hypothetical protein